MQKFKLLSFFLLVLTTFNSEPKLQDWWVAHVPDTQAYTQFQSTMYPYQFQIGMLTQLSWRPSYVAHVGDITQDALPEEFIRGMDTMRFLDPYSIPYGISIGNHDYRSTGNKKSGTASWQTYVGPLNTINTFQSPHGEIGVLHLEWHPSDSAINFAVNWMEQNPTTPTILVTHAWVMPPYGFPPGSRIPGNTSPRETVGTNFDGSGDNSAEIAYQKMVVAYPQIFLVLSGHNWTMARRVDVTPLGAEVHQTCADFQGDPNGGNGWIRAVGFQGQRMILYDHSWTYNGNGPNRFFVEPVTVQRTPRQVRDWLSSHTIWRNRSAIDTYVAPCWGGIIVRTNYDWLWAAGNGCQEHGLMRFDTTGSPNVKTAILQLTIEGYSTEGEGFALHRMLRPWKDTDSWNSLGGLVSGRDYEVIPDVSVPAHGKGTINLDVTKSVQAWQSGQANYGWVFVGVGESSGCRTSDWHELMERPMLVIQGN